MNIICFGVCNLVKQNYKKGNKNMKLSKIQLKLLDEANKGYWVHPKNNEKKAMEKLVKLGIFKLNEERDGFSYTTNAYITTDIGNKLIADLAKLSWSESWDGTTITL